MEHGICWHKQDYRILQIVYHHYILNYDIQGYSIYCSHREQADPHFDLMKPLTYDLHPNRYDCQKHADQAKHIY